jgi:hypothetical protein
MAMHCHGLGKDDGTAPKRFGLVRVNDFVSLRDEGRSGQKRGYARNNRFQ